MDRLNVRHYQINIFKHVKIFLYEKTRSLIGHRKANIIQKHLFIGNRIKLNFGCKVEIKPVLADCYHQKRLILLEGVRELFYSREYLLMEVKLQEAAQVLLRLPFPIVDEKVQPLLVPYECDPLRCEANALEWIFVKLFLEKLLDLLCFGIILQDDEVVVYLVSAHLLDRLFDHKIHLLIKVDELHAPLPL